MQAGVAQQLPLALKLRRGKTFADFVVGEQPDVLPLLRALVHGQQHQVYLYGSESTGKSHLLEACTRELEDKGKRACLLSATLLKELPPAALTGLEAGASLVAIDELDVLAGQPEWEEALFHLYNRAREQGVPLLFAGQSSPRQAGFTLADLRSRLGAGPVVRLSAPNEDTLQKILLLQAKARGMRLSPDVAAYILKRAERQPAALTQLMDQLDEAALADGRRLTIPFIKQQLGW